MNNKCWGMREWLTLMVTSVFALWKFMLHEVNIALLPCVCLFFFFSCWSILSRLLTIWMPLGFVYFKLLVVAAAQWRRCGLLTSVAQVWYMLHITWFYLCPAQTRWFSVGASSVVMAHAFQCCGSGLILVR